MRVFVYEYLTALGIGCDPTDPLHSLHREGRAMRDAVAEDFVRLPGVDVVTLGGVAANEERAAFRERVRASDWTLLIAPEFDDILRQRCEWVQLDRGRLLGPAADVVSFVGDKLDLAERWRRCGVPTPATSDREPTNCEAFPVVWKPRYGAGSTATFLLNNAIDVVRAKAQRVAEGHAGAMILQQYVAGRAASIAFVCGAAGCVLLVPCMQYLSDDGRFKYRGGELPIAPELAKRAVALGTRAVGCVPGLVGFVGVDLVLGDAPDGSRDYAIEINPRLTTSYIGLRALAAFNISEAILRTANSDPLPNLKWKPGRTRFSPDGGTFQNSLDLPRAGV